MRPATRKWSKNQTGTPPLGPRSGTFREPADQGDPAARTISAGHPASRTGCGSAAPETKRGPKIGPLSHVRWSSLPQLDRRSGVLELLLDGRRLVLPDVLLDRL